MAYYVLTSIQNNRILATRAFDEAYIFIKENQDVKIWSLRMYSRPKLRPDTCYMDKRRFLLQFYKNSNKSWADRIKVFEMAEILLTNASERTALFFKARIRKDYWRYKKIMEAKL